MKVYRIFDKQLNTFIKIGKRTNDIYVNKDLVRSTLKRFYNIEKIDDRFNIVEYDLVRVNKKEGN